MKKIWEFIKVIIFIIGAIVILDYFLDFNSGGITFNFSRILNDISVWIK